MKLDYMQRLTLGITTAKEKFPAGVYMTEVAHDTWCGIYKNKSCSCTPDVRFTVDDKKFEVDEEGVLHEVK